MGAKEKQEAIFETLDATKSGIKKVKEIFKDNPLLAYWASMAIAAQGSELIRIFSSKPAEEFID